MQRLFCLLALALTLPAERAAWALSTDANDALAFDDCPGLPTANVPRFAACHVKATVRERGWDQNGALLGDEYRGYDAIIGCNGRSVIITNYLVSKSGTNPAEVCLGEMIMRFSCRCYASVLASDFGFNCGLYTGREDDC